MYARSVMMKLIASMIIMSLCVLAHWASAQEPPLLPTLQTFSTYRLDVLSRVQSEDSDHLTNPNAHGLAVLSLALHAHNPVVFELPKKYGENDENQHSTFLVDTKFIFPNTVEWSNRIMNGVQHAGCVTYGVYYNKKHHFYPHASGVSVSDNSEHIVLSLTYKFDAIVSEEEEENGGGGGGGPPTPSYIPTSSLLQSMLIQCPISNQAENAPPSVDPTSSTSLDSYVDVTMKYSTTPDDASHDVQVSTKRIWSSTTSSPFTLPSTDIEQLSTLEDADLRGRLMTVPPLPRKFEADSGLPQSITFACMVPSNLIYGIAQETNGLRSYPYIGIELKMSEAFKQSVYSEATARVELTELNERYTYPLYVYSNPSENGGSGSWGSHVAPNAHTIPSRNPYVNNRRGTIGVMIAPPSVPIVPPGGTPTSIPQFVRIHFVCEGLKNLAPGQYWDFHIQVVPAVVGLLAESTPPSPPTPPNLPYVHYTPFVMFRSKDLAKSNQEEDENTLGKDNGGIFVVQTNAASSYALSISVQNQKGDFVIPNAASGGGSASPPTTFMTNWYIRIRHRNHNMLTVQNGNSLAYQGNVCLEIMSNLNIVDGPPGESGIPSSYSLTPPYSLFHQIDTSGISVYTSNSNVGSYGDNVYVSKASIGTSSYVQSRLNDIEEDHTKHPRDLIKICLSNRNNPNSNVYTPYSLPSSFYSYIDIVLNNVKVYDDTPHRHRTYGDLLNDASSMRIYHEPTQLVLHYYHNNGGNDGNSYFNGIYLGGRSGGLYSTAAPFVDLEHKNVYVPSASTPAIASYTPTFLPYSIIYPYPGVITRVRIPLSYKQITSMAQLNTVQTLVWTIRSLNANLLDHLGNRLQTLRVIFSSVNDGSVNGNGVYSYTSLTNAYYEYTAQRVSETPSSTLYSFTMALSSITPTPPANMQVFMTRFNLIEFDMVHITPSTYTRPLSFRFQAASQEKDPGNGRELMLLSDEFNLSKMRSRSELINGIPGVNAMSGSGSINSKCEMKLVGNSALPDTDVGYTIEFNELSISTYSSNFNIEVVLPSDFYMHDLELMDATTRNTVLDSISVLVLNAQNSILSSALKFSKSLVKYPLTPSSSSPPQVGLLLKAVYTPQGNPGNHPPSSASSAPLIHFTGIRVVLPSSSFGKSPQPRSILDPAGSARNGWIRVYSTVNKLDNSGNPMTNPTDLETAETRRRQAFQSILSLGGDTSSSAESYIVNLVAEAQLMAMCIPHFNNNNIYQQGGSYVSGEHVNAIANDVYPIAGDELNKAYIPILERDAANAVTNVLFKVPNTYVYSATTHLTINVKCPEHAVVFEGVGSNQNAHIELITFADHEDTWPNLDLMGGGIHSVIPFAETSAVLWNQGGGNANSFVIVKGRGTPALTGKPLYVRLNGFINPELGITTPVQCTTQAVFDESSVSPPPTYFQLYRYAVPLPAPLVIPGQVKAWYTNPRLVSKTSPVQNPPDGDDPTGFIEINLQSDLIIKFEAARDSPTLTDYRYFIDIPMHVITKSSGSVPPPTITISQNAFDVSDVDELSLIDINLDYKDEDSSSDIRTISFGLSRDVKGVYFSITLSKLYVTSPNDVPYIYISVHSGSQRKTSALFSRTRAYISSRYTLAHYPGLYARPNVWAAWTSTTPASLLTEQSLSNDYAWPSVYGVAGFASSSLVQAGTNSIEAQALAGNPTLARCYYSESDSSISPQPSSSSTSSPIPPPQPEMLFNAATRSKVAGMPVRMVFQFDFPSKAVVKIQDQHHMAIHVHIPAEIMPFERAKKILQDKTSTLIGIFTDKAVTSGGAPIRSKYIPVKHSKISIHESLLSDAPGVYPKCFTFLTNQQGENEIIQEQSSVCGSKIANADTLRVAGRFITIAFELPSTTQIVGYEGYGGLNAELINEAESYWIPPYARNSNGDVLTNELHTLSFFIDSSLILAPSPDIAMDLTRSRVLVQGLRGINLNLAKTLPNDSHPGELVPSDWIDTFTEPWMGYTQFHFPLTRPANALGVGPQGEGANSNHKVATAITHLPLSLFTLTNEGAEPIANVVTEETASSLRLDVLTSTALNVDAGRTVNTWPNPGTAVVMNSGTFAYATKGSPVNITLTLVPNWSNYFKTDFENGGITVADQEIPGTWSGTEMIDITLPKSLLAIKNAEVALNKPSADINLQDLQLIRKLGLSVNIWGYYSMREDSNHPWTNWSALASTNVDLSQIDKVGTWRNATSLVIPLVQALPSDSLVRVALTGNLKLFVTRCEITLSAPLALQRAIAKDIPLGFDISPQQGDDSITIHSSNAGGSVNGVMAPGDQGITQNQLQSYTRSELKRAVAEGFALSLPGAYDVLSESPYAANGAGVLIPQRQTTFVEVSKTKLQTISSIVSDLEQRLGLTLPLSDPQSIQGLAENRLKGELKSHFVANPFSSVQLYAPANPPVDIALHAMLPQAGKVIEIPILRNDLSSYPKLPVPLPAALRLARQSYTTVLSSFKSPLKIASVSPDYLGSEDITLTLPLELAAPPSRVSIEGRVHLLVVTADTRQQLQSVYSAQLRVSYNQPNFALPPLTNPSGSEDGGVFKGSVWPLRIVKKREAHLVLEIPVANDGSPELSYEPVNALSGEGGVMHWPNVYPGAKFEIKMQGYVPLSLTQGKVIVSTIRRNSAIWPIGEFFGPILSNGEGGNIQPDSPFGSGVSALSEMASNWIPTPMISKSIFPKASVSLSSVSAGVSPTMELRLQLNALEALKGWDKDSLLVFMLPTFTADSIVRANSGTHGALLPAYLPGVKAETTLSVNSPLGWYFDSSARISSIRWSAQYEGAPKGQTGTVDLTEYVELALFTREGYERLTEADEPLPKASSTSSVSGVTMSPPSTGTHITYYETSNQGLSEFIPMQQDYWAHTANRLTVAVIRYKQGSQAFTTPLPTSHIVLNIHGIGAIPPLGAPRLPVEARLVSTARSAVLRSALMTSAQDRDAQKIAGRSLELPYATPLPLSTEVLVRQNTTTSYSGSKLAVQVRIARAHETHDIMSLASNTITTTQISNAKVILENTQSSVEVSSTGIHIDLPPEYIPVRPSTSEGGFSEPQVADGIEILARFQFIAFDTVVSKAIANGFGEAVALTSIESALITKLQEQAPLGTKAVSLSHVSRVLRSWGGEFDSDSTVITRVVKALAVTSSQGSLFKYVVKIPLDAQVVASAVQLFGTSRIPEGSVVRIQLDSIVNPSSPMSNLKTLNQLFLSSMRMTDPQTGSGKKNPSSYPWEDWLNPSSSSSSSGANLLSPKARSENEGVSLSFIHSLTGGANYIATGPTPLVLLKDFRPLVESETGTPFSADLTSAIQRNSPVIIPRASSIVVSYSNKKGTNQLAKTGDNLEFEILASLPYPLGPLITSDHAFRGNSDLISNRIPSGTRVEVKLPLIWVPDTNIYSNCDLRASLFVNNNPLLFKFEDGSTKDVWKFTNYDRLTQTFANLEKASLSEGTLALITYLSPPLSASVPINHGNSWKLQVSVECVGVSVGKMVIPSPQVRRSLQNASIFMRLLVPATYSSSVARSILPGASLAPLFGNNLGALVPPSLGQFFNNGWMLSLGSNYANTETTLTIGFTLRQALKQRSILVVSINNNSAKQDNPMITSGFSFSPFSAPILGAQIEDVAKENVFGVRKISDGSQLAREQLLLQVLRDIPSLSHLTITIPTFKTPSHAGVYVVHNSMLPNKSPLFTFSILNPDNSIIMSPLPPTNPLSIDLITA